MTANDLQHCATFWDKNHANAECLHHEEYFETAVRVYHLCIGICAFGLLAVVGRVLMRVRDSKVLQIEPLLLFVLGGVLLVLHSFLKAFTSTCISNTESGAECGQLFIYIVFDILSLSHSLAMLCHPCMASWPRLTSFCNKNLKKMYISLYLVPTLYFVLSWLQTKRPSILAPCTVARFAVFFGVTVLWIQYWSTLKTSFPCFRRGNLYFWTFCASCVLVIAAADISASLLLSSADSVHHVLESKFLSQSLSALIYHMQVWFIVLLLLAEHAMSIWALHECEATIPMTSSSQLPMVESFMTNGIKSLLSSKRFFAENSITITVFCVSGWAHHLWTAYHKTAREIQRSKWGVYSGNVSQSLPNHREGSFALLASTTNQDVQEATSDQDLGLYWQSHSTMVILVLCYLSPFVSTLMTQHSCLKRSMKPSGPQIAKFCKSQQIDEQVPVRKRSQVNKAGEIRKYVRHVASYLVQKGMIKGVQDVQSFPDEFWKYRNSTQDPSKAKRSPEFLAETAAALHFVKMYFVPSELSLPCNEEEAWGICHALSGPVANGTAGCFSVGSWLPRSLAPTFRDVTMFHGIGKWFAKQLLNHFFPEPGSEIPEKQDFTEDSQLDTTQPLELAHNPPVQILLGGDTVHKLRQDLIETQRIAEAIEWCKSSDLLLHVGESVSCGTWSPSDESPQSASYESYQSSETPDGCCGDDSSMTDISAAGSQICQCCTSSSNELSLPTIDEAIHQEPPSSPPLLPDDATSPLLPDDAFAIFDFDMASSIHMQSEQYKGSTDISSENVMRCDHMPLVYMNDKLPLHTAVLQHADICALSSSTGSSMSVLHPPEASAYMEAVQAQHALKSSPEVQGVKNMQPSKKSYTRFLTSWVEEHQDELYPAQWVKEKLASASGATLKQIENWFANQRRRRKSVDI